MDEQQTALQQQQSNEDVQPVEWSSEADGLAAGSTSFDDDAESYVSDGRLESDSSEEITSRQGNIKLNRDGEVEIRDEFFSDLDSEQPKEPAKYTVEELKATPWEQWEIDRLEGDVRDFAPIVREQMHKRQMQYQMASRPSEPPYIPQVKPYTPKELADEAQKLACERLGLEDPDDFDTYENEHRAALDLAMQELSQKRNAEIQSYQRVAESYHDLQRFNAELVNRPDYMEFDRWFTGKLQQHGVTPEQLNAGLMEYARRSSGDYRSLQGVIAGWYKEFQAERGARSRHRGNMPPVLESTRGSGYEGRRTMDMSKFGNLDPDAQAKALMNMGLV